MTTITDDEREAREWLRVQARDAQPNSYADRAYRTILALLDAAEAGAKAQDDDVIAVREHDLTEVMRDAIRQARDAALEEAAAIADSESKMATGHKGDPYYAGKWTAAEIIGDRIRALKARTA